VGAGSWPDKKNNKSGGVHFKPPDVAWHGNACIAVTRGQHNGTPSTTVEGEGIMATSRFELTGRFLAGIAAASLLAGVSLDAAAYGSKGRIALQTGKTLSAFQFTYEVATSADWATYSTPRTQAILPGTKGCLLLDMPYATGSDLARLNAFGPRGVDLAGTLGWVATSIGVHDGPQGTDCGRVSNDKTEAIGLTLGSGIPAPTATATPANAYDRLEIDVEVKGDVDLTLAVMFEGRTTTYRLLAGSGKVSEGTADPEGKVLRPGDQVYRCSAATDGGADAGPKDNCRWIIEDLGTSFKIIPHSGEFSLEGGGDHDNVIANRTLIYLTEADGILDCGDTISAESSQISCEITRLDPPPGYSACVVVPYVFRASADEPSCTLTSDMGGQQLVANLFVKYDAEPAKTLPGGVDLEDLEVWLPADLSKVSFDSDTSPGTEYDIPPCLGLTLTNIDLSLRLDSNHEPLPRIGPDPIPQIDDAGPDGVYDRIEDDDFIQFACAFMRQEVYETDLAEPLIQKVRIEEGIQFWGDISFARGAN